MFLNPGPPSCFTLLTRLIAENRYQFLCHLKLYQKDGKVVASNLARLGKNTCYLIPSDCMSLLMGRAGFWWEVGRGERYTAETDSFATSTAILSHTNITGAYTDESRIECHRNPVGLHRLRYDGAGFELAGTPVECVKFPGLNKLELSHGEQLETLDQLLGMSACVGFDEAGPLVHGTY